VDNTIYLKGIRLIDSEETEINFNKFPFNLSVVKYIEKFIFDTPVTILLGENGVGKSTLIEAIAIAIGFNAEGGNKNIRFSSYDSHSDLFKYITLKRLYLPKNGFFFRSETLYSLETKLSEYYENWKLHDLSHGQGTIEILKEYFKPNGIYILDEPESALSPTSQFAFLNLVHDYAEHYNCQFIIATHSPIVAGYNYAKIYEISVDSEPLITEYEDTSLIALYKRYISDPNYRKYLLEIEND